MSLEEQTKQLSQEEILLILAKVEGLGEARSKKIKKMLESQSKFLKKSNQKTLHDS